jgi:YVTN family beta-propeller protein
MFVISPDGRRIYTANNEAGSVSVLDLPARKSDNLTLGRFL